MLTLTLTVLLVILVSALCSTAEAALYSVPWTEIEKMRASGSPKGHLLFALRSNIEKPIAAVLALNTVANTAGAALAGALAADALGADNMPLFAGALTLLILAFGEILPKTVGVAYATPIAAALAMPLRMLVIVFKPFIWLSGKLTRLVTRSRDTTPSATEDDIRAITTLSRESGRIQAYEANAIRNILTLDAKHVHEIMTPRTMVFSLPETMLVSEAYALPEIWHYSRIPVYGDDNEDIVGLVLRRRVARAKADGAEDKPLSALMEPVRFILESQTLDRLLLELLESRLHLFVVLDEYGGLAGVVSLEDVLEEMLGREIVDDSDAVPDLREAARLRRSAVMQASAEASEPQPATGAASSRAEKAPATPAARNP